MTNTTVRLAAGWAAAYGTLALGWTVTGHGFPFGPDDPGRPASPLKDLDASVGAPLFAGVLLVTAIALLVMSGRDLPRGPVRSVLLGGLWTVAALLLVVVPDVRLLTIAGYLPILIVGLPFGWPPVDYSEVFTWALGNQAFALAGGLLIARAAIGWQRRTAGVCVSCGGAHIVRWGKLVTWIAALIPATYAAVRLSWAAGIPLGIPRSFLHEMQDSGLVWAGAGLGAFALAGSWLTIGLIRPWGERFPRWMIWAAGKRVPIKLATIPATLVAIFVTSASIAFYTTGGLARLIRGDLDAATAPILLWPFWGAALGAATYAYHLRRRGACPVCGPGAGTQRLVEPPMAGAY